MTSNFISAKNEDFVKVSWFCSLPLLLRSLDLDNRYHRIKNFNKEHLKLDGPQDPQRWKLSEFLIFLKIQQAPSCHKLGVFSFQIFFGLKAAKSF